MAQMQYRLSFQPHRRIAHTSTSTSLIPQQPYGLAPSAPLGISHRIPCAASAPVPPSDQVQQPSPSPDPTTSGPTVSSTGGAATAGAQAEAEAQPAAAAAPAADALPPGYDPSLAKAWQPPPGEPPLWFVQKYEARRKQEALRKAHDPGYVTTEERMRKEGLGARTVRVMLQLVQLAVVLALLLLLPASLAPGGLERRAVWSAYCLYFAFFAAGSVYRIVTHGPLAQRSHDKQHSSLGARAAFAGFVVVVPLLHMAAAFRYAALRYAGMLPSAAGGWSVYDVLGWAGALGAIALNAAAARALGQSYDRVVAPERLVTHGPYALVQHPIYASYMLLFLSYALLLHSAPLGLALVAVCLAYYSVRAGLEAQVLRGAFGEQYEGYAAATKRFVPGLL